jgi:hypothetical protein
MFEFVYDAAVTPEFGSDMVPVVVIVPPDRPVPAVMLVTADPLDAAVNLPCASTVTFESVYDPGVTAVFAREIVPVVVIGPPESPVPVATFVTVPLAVPAIGCHAEPSQMKPPGVSVS